MCSALNHEKNNPISGRWILTFQASERATVRGAPFDAKSISKSRPSHPGRGVPFKCWINKIATVNWSWLGWTMTKSWIGRLAFGLWQSLSLADNFLKYFSWLMNKNCFFRWLLHIELPLNAFWKSWYNLSKIWGSNNHTPQGRKFVISGKRQDQESRLLLWNYFVSQDSLERLKFQ